MPFHPGDLMLEMLRNDSRSAPSADGCRPLPRQPGAQLHAVTVEAPPACCTTPGLVDLLELVPALLEACTQGPVIDPYIHGPKIKTSTPAIRRLRLVSKDASRVALNAVRAFTLTLMGAVSSTDLGGGGVKLLQHIKLDTLTVRILSSGGEQAR